MLTTALLCSLVACKEEPPPGPSMESALRHAELQGTNKGHMVVIEMRDFVLLHPNSDRQRQARRQLLRLQQLVGDGADQGGAGRRHTQLKEPLAED